MNDTEKIILLGGGMIALSIILSSYIIADRVSKSLDEKNFWEGSDIPQVASDVHAVTEPLGQLGQLLSDWTRA